VGRIRLGSIISEMSFLSGSLNRNVVVGTECVRAATFKLKYLYFKAFNTLIIFNAP
jgi:hypothetical protein